MCFRRLRGSAGDRPRLDAIYFDYAIISYFPFFKHILFAFLMIFNNVSIFLCSRQINNLLQIIEIYEYFDFLKCVVFFIAPPRRHIFRLRHHSIFSIFKTHFVRFFIDFQQFFYERYLQTGMKFTYHSLWEISTNRYEIHLP